MQVEAKEGAKPLAAKSPIAGVVEVHSMIMESGVVASTLVIEDRVGQRQTFEVSASARMVTKPVDRHTLKALQKQEGHKHCGFKVVDILHLGIAYSRS